MRELGARGGLGGLGSITALGPGRGRRDGGGIRAARGLGDYLEAEEGGLVELESQDHGAVVGGADPGCGAPGYGGVEVVAADWCGLFEGVAVARGPVLSLDFDADAAAGLCYRVEPQAVAVEAEGWGPELGVLIAHQAGQAAARPGGPGDAFAVPRRGVLVRGRERPVGDADTVAG